MKKLVLLLAGSLLFLAGCETDHDWHHRGGSYGDYDDYGRGHGYYRSYDGYPNSRYPSQTYPNYNTYPYYR